MFTTPIRIPVAADAAAAVERNRLMSPKPDSGGDQHQRLTAQTEKWVAQTFYGQLLKQMRESPFHSDMFEGGNGGKTFETLFDQRLADHMSHHAGAKLVNSIVRKIEAGEAAKRYENAGKPRAATAGRSPHSGQKPRILPPAAKAPLVHVPRGHAPHPLHGGSHGMPERHAGMLLKAPQHTAGKHF
jgi:Rod binding domain-containing protein